MSSRLRQRKNDYAKSQHPNCYEVSKIIARRQVGSRGVVEYRVRWKGFGPDDDTWEPIHHLKFAQQALADFNKRTPSAVNQPLRSPSNLQDPLRSPSTRMDRPQGSMLPGSLHPSPKPSIVTHLRPDFLRRTTIGSQRGVAAGQSMPQRSAPTAGRRGFSANDLNEEPEVVVPGGVSKVNRLASRQDRGSIATAVNPQNVIRPSIAPVAANRPPYESTLGEQWSRCVAPCSETNEMSLVNKQLISLTTNDLPMLIFCSLLVALVVTFLI